MFVKSFGFTRTLFDAVPPEVKVWKRVKANKGSAGVDGMTIQDA